MINIDIADSNRKKVAERLNLLLANEYVLYTKTLKFHWNVVGPFFGPLHALFQKQYEQLLDIVDEVAERVRALDHMSHGTLKEFAANTTLPEEPGKNPDSAAMIRLLLEDHEAIIRQIRKDIDYVTELQDMGTNNFLSELIETHEKTAWMLRAHLQ
jgi:starvation-inducible DNA-binding protein